MPENPLREALRRAESKLDDVLNFRVTGNAGQDPAAEWAVWARKLPIIFERAKQARDEVRAARSALAADPGGRPTGDDDRELLNNLIAFRQGLGALDHAWERGVLGKAYNRIQRHPLPDPAEEKGGWVCGDCNRWNPTEAVNCWRCCDEAGLCRGCAERLEKCKCPAEERARAGSVTEALRFIAKNSTQPFIVNRANDALVDLAAEVEGEGARGEGVKVYVCESDDCEEWNRSQGDWHYGEDKMVDGQRFCPLCDEPLTTYIAYPAPVSGDARCPKCGSDDPSKDKLARNPGAAEVNRHSLLPDDRCPDGFHTPTEDHCPRCLSTEREWTHSSCWVHLGGKVDPWHSPVSRQEGDAEQELGKDVARLLAAVARIRPGGRGTELRTAYQDAAERLAQALPKASKGD